MDLARITALEHLSLVELAYGRDAANIEAMAGDWSTAQVRALVRHDDPKVRAVALVLLHEQLGPGALPTIVEFLGDPAAAPPSRERILGTVPGEKPFRDRPQTVGLVAQSLIGQYLPNTLTERYVGSSRFLSAWVLRRAFADYLRTRHGRAHCLVWLKVATQRATGGINPTPPKRMPQIAAARQRIDAIPAPERHWYLLSLANDWSLPGAEHLATERELVEAARALGSAALLRLLRGFGPADGEAVDPSVDPDLTAARHSAFAWEPVVRFVLRHGGELFPADRCDELLQIAETHVLGSSRGVGVGRDGILVADWYFAAADLQPERAAAHIAAGLDAIPRDPPNMFYLLERGRLAAAAWTRLGEEGKRLAVEWFYTEGPQRDFTAGLARPERARLLWTLVADPRFDGVGWVGLEGMARASNAHVPDPPPFPESVLRATQHPLGNHYDGNKDEALARYPEETRALEQTLRRWRDRLRELAREHGN